MVKNKKLFILIICVAVVIVLFASFFGTYFFLLQQVPEKETIESRSSRFFSNNKSYVVAEYPYIDDGVFETISGLQSFYYKYRNKASVIEINIQVTKDGKAVVFSDSLKKYSNAHILYENSEYVSELTLDELKKVNLAYNYSDENGQMFYKAYNEDNIEIVNILTLEEFINWFFSQRSDFPCFAIKFYDEDDIDNVEAVLDDIQSVFASVGFPDFYFVSVNSKKIADIIDKNYPDILRSATKSEAKDLFKSALRNKDVTVPYEIIYTNSNEGMFGKFASEKFISFANNSNLALILNDAKAEDVSNFASLGVDGFVTSDIEEYYTIIKDEYTQRKLESKSIN